MNLLAIDVGGTEIKSAIVDADYNLSNWIVSQLLKIA